MEQSAGMKVTIAAILNLNDLYLKKKKIYYFTVAFKENQIELISSESLAKKMNHSEL